MRVWFDTEFHENGTVIELISIGMVREDGETLYAQVPWAQSIASRTPWLAENVRPHLSEDWAIRI